MMFSFDCQIVYTFAKLSNAFNRFCLETEVVLAALLEVESA
jgi:hypothetical protein